MAISKRRERYSNCVLLHKQKNTPLQVSGKTVKGILMNVIPSARSYYLLKQGLSVLFGFGFAAVAFVSQLSATSLYEAAEKGDAEAQVNLGMMYSAGLGVEKDEAAAFRWIQKAADQGHGEAQFILGLMFNEGIGTAKDESEAVTWYRKAADHGERRAQYQLARAYALGRGVAEDLHEAAQWYRRAAEQGLVHAQVSLALLYETGTGVEKDASEALRWYLKAAEQGDAAAQFRAGLICKDDLKNARYHVRVRVWDAKELHRSVQMAKLGCRRRSPKRRSTRTCEKTLGRAGAQVDDARSGGRSAESKRRIRSEAAINTAAPARTSRRRPRSD
jgi:TPR repeat protein